MTQGVEIKVKPRSRWRDLAVILRNRLVTGIIVALPVVATVTLLSWAINAIDNLVYRLLPNVAEPQSFLGVRIPGFGVIVAIILLILLGSLARNIFGKSLIKSFEAALLRLPVVSNIYNFVKQVVSVVSRNNEDAFKEVCLIEYPKAGIWAIGFVTAELRGAPKQHLIEEYACVFVPTTPNPTSGFLLFARRADIKILDMTVEEGAKLIISGGMVTSNDDLEDVVDELTEQDEPELTLPSLVRRRNPARKGTEAT